TVIECCGRTGEYQHACAESGQEWALGEKGHQNDAQYSREQGTQTLVDALLQDLRVGWREERDHPGDHRPDRALHLQQHGNEKRTPYGDTELDGCLHRQLVAEQIGIQHPGRHRLTSAFMMVKTASAGSRAAHASPTAAHSAGPARCAPSAWRTYRRSATGHPEYG